MASEVDFIDGEEYGFAATDEEAGEFEVGRGELSAAVDDHNDGVGFVEGDLRLAEDFGWDEGFVVGHDTAGVDDAGVAALPFDFAVDAVARNAWFVADDAATGAGEAVEERGFADVGAAADSDERQGFGGGVLHGDGLLEGEEFGFAPVGFLAFGGRGGDAAAQASGAFAGALLCGLLLGGGAEVTADGRLGIVGGDGFARFEIRRATRDALGGGLLGFLCGQLFALLWVDGPNARRACGSGRFWGAPLFGASAGLPVLLAETFCCFLRCHGAPSSDAWCAIVHYREESPKGGADRRLNSGLRGVDYEPDVALAEPQRRFSRRG